MKKLLTLLGVISLTSTTAITVVACKSPSKDEKNKEETKEEKKDSRINLDSVTIEDAEILLANPASLTSITEVEDVKNAILIHVLTTLQRKNENITRRDFTINNIAQIRVGLSKADVERVEFSVIAISGSKYLDGVSKRFKITLKSQEIGRTVLDLSSVNIPINNIIHVTTIPATLTDVQARDIQTKLINIVKRILKLQLNTVVESDFTIDNLSKIKTGISRTDLENLKFKVLPASGTARLKSQSKEFKISLEVIDNRVSLRSLIFENIKNGKYDRQVNNINDVTIPEIDKLLQNIQNEVKLSLKSSFETLNNLTEGTDYTIYNLDKLTQLKSKQAKVTAADLQAIEFKVVAKGTNLKDESTTFRLNITQNSNIHIGGDNDGNNNGENNGGDTGGEVVTPTVKTTNLREVTFTIPSTFIENTSDLTEYKTVIKTSIENAVISKLQSLDNTIIKSDFVIDGIDKIKDITTLDDLMGINFFVRPAPTVTKLEGRTANFKANIKVDIKNIEVTELILEYVQNADSIAAEEKAKIKQQVTAGVLRALRKVYSGITEDDYTIENLNQIDTVTTLVELKAIQFKIISKSGLNAKLANDSKPFTVNVQVQTASS